MELQEMSSEEAWQAISNEEQVAIEGGTPPVIVDGLIAWGTVSGTCCLIVAAALA